MSLDTLSNMISSIKNAYLVRKPFVEVPHTKQCEAVAKVLKDNNYVTGVKVFKESGSSFKRLHIDIAYEENGLPVINEIKRVSKPGRRIYKGSDDLGNFKYGYGISIVSTSRGVMSGDDARNKKLGGEVICQVY